MKTVKYSGPAASLGRFGIVEDGAHLQLLDTEWETCKDDPRFVLLSRRKPTKDVLPLGTSIYDLRTIQWSHERIGRRFRDMGKTPLRLIAKAMVMVGADVIVTEHDSREVTIDAILSEARVCGWDKLDKDQLAALPSLEDAPVETSYGDLSLKDLRDLCGSRGLSKGGSKDDIIARLIESDASQTTDPATEGDDDGQGEDQGEDDGQGEEE